MEFAREKEALFNHWCVAQNVTDYTQLCQLVLIEEFKDGLPDAVAMYINEQRATTLDKAAVLADEYVLTHRVGMHDRPRKNETLNRVKPPSETSSPRQPDSSHRPASEVKCNYCKKPGHIVEDCL